MLLPSSDDLDFLCGPPLLHTITKRGRRALADTVAVVHRYYLAILRMHLVQELECDLLH